MNNCPIVLNTDEKKCAISNNCPTCTACSFMSWKYSVPGFLWGRWSRSRRRRCLPWTGTSSRSSRSRTHRPPRSPQSASSWRAPHLHSDHQTAHQKTSSRHMHSIKGQHVWYQQKRPSPTCPVFVLDHVSRMHMDGCVLCPTNQQQLSHVCFIFPFCYFPCQSVNSTYTLNI